MEQMGGLSHKERRDKGARRIDDGIRRRAEINEEFPFEPMKRSRAFLVEQEELDAETKGKGAKIKDIHSEQIQKYIQNKHRKMQRLRILK